MAWRLAVGLAMRTVAAPAGDAAPAKPTWTIGMSQCNLGEPWRVQMNADIRRPPPTTHPEIKVIFKDAQNDTLKQRAQVEEFVSAGVDLSSSRPRRRAADAARRRRRCKKGSRSSCSTAGVLGDEYTCFIGADNKKIGRAAGEWIAKRSAAKARSWSSRD